MESLVPGEVVADVARFGDGASGRNVWKQAWIDRNDEWVVRESDVPGGSAERKDAVAIQAITLMTRDGSCIGIQFFYHLYDFFVCWFFVGCMRCRDNGIFKIGQNGCAIDCRRRDHVKA